MKKKTATILKTALVLAAIPVCELNAITRSWDGGAGDGNWFSGTNWNPDGTPGTSDVLSVITGSWTINANAMVNLYANSDVRLSGSGVVVNMNGSGSYGIYSGTSATDSAKLTLTSGATLNSSFASMGGSGLSDISITNSTWNINSPAPSSSWLGSSGTCNLNMSYSTLSVTNSQLSTGYNETGIFNGTISGSLIQSNNVIRLGYSGKSYLTLNNSADITTSSNTFLALSNTSYSEVNMSGTGTTLNSNILYCGYGGTGTINVTDNADITTSYLNLGYNNGSNGTINLSDSGSSLTVSGNAYCGFGMAQGTINLNNGASMIVSGSMTVDDLGTINLNESSLICNSLTGGGLVNFNSGYLTVNNGLTFGSNSPMGSYIDWSNKNTLATYGGITIEPGVMARFDDSSVSGYSLTNEADIYVRTGGSVTFSGTATNSGLVNIDGGTFGGNSLVNNYGAQIYGRGNINSTNQAITNNGTLSNSGQLTFNNSIDNGGQINVNSYYSGSLKVSGALNNSGTINMNGSLIATSLNNGSLGIISGNGSISGTTTNNGGLIYATGGTLAFTDFSGGNNNGGELRVADGATLRVGDSLRNESQITMLGNNASLVAGNYIDNFYGTITGAGRISSFVNNYGQIYADNGNLTIGKIINYSSGLIEVEKSAKVSVTSGISANDGTIALHGGRFDNGRYDMSSNGNILGNGTLSALSVQNYGYIGVGDGDLTVVADDFYQYGSVNVQKDCTLTFYGDVAGPGAFNGSGTVVFLAGYAPGSSPAAVSIDGNMTLEGILTMELAGTTLGSEYDHLSVGGVASLSGVLEIALLDGFVPAYGDSFDLFDFAQYTGAFTSIIAPELGGLRFDYSELYTTGVLTVVPEPTSMALLAGAALFAARRRK